MIQTEYNTYMTLQEVVKYLSYPTQFPPGFAAVEKETPGPSMIEDMVQYFIGDGSEWPTAYPAIATVDEHDHVTWGDHIEDLLEVVFNRYANEYAAVARVWAFPWQDVSGEIPSVAMDACRSFVRSFLTILNATYGRHKTILDAYAGQAATLMDPVVISSSALTRHNDAPQNSGDYSGDDYTSDYAETTAEQQTDHGTPMDRLNQLTSSYRNVLDDWAHDFRGLFLLKENIE